MILYVLRHGQADHNLSHTMNADPLIKVNLTKLGVEQAQTAAKNLMDKNIDIIYASELPRARQTAEHISKFLQKKILLDKRLNEIKSGVEGKSVEEYRKKREDLVKQHHCDRRDVHINDGESFNDVKKRVKEFLEELKTKKYNNVLIVTHFDTLIAIEETIKKKNSNLRPKNAEIFTFDI